MSHARYEIRAAFTLIELLVVISIIALLVGILLPALGAARKSAQTAVCLSNMRQIGVAEVSYLNDYNFTFYEYTGSVTGLREWSHGGEPVGGPDDPRPLNMYIGDNREVFHCPLDNGRSDTPYSEITPNMWTTVGSSYLFNVIGIPDKWGTFSKNSNPNVANKADDIQTTSRFVIFGEYALLDVNWRPMTGGGPVVSGWGNGLQGSGNYHEAFYEDPSCVLTFADGHAERIKNIRGLGAYSEDFTLIPGK